MSRRRRILVVEDDEGVRRMYRSALAFGGFDVLEARDGMTALRLVEEKRPDGIILDLGLPGVDGFTVLQDVAARTTTQRIPIIVVTGSTENLESLNVSCVVRKPISPERLVAEVLKCLPE